MPVCFKVWSPWLGAAAGRCGHDFDIGVQKRQFRNDPGLRMVLSRHPESVIHTLDVGN